MFQFLNFLRILFLFVSTLIFFSCYSQKEYDRELMTPDIDNAGMSHGYNLTPLGCLVDMPWHFESSRDIYNEKIYHNEKLLSNKPATYDFNQKSIVFEFHKNGVFKYWFKQDYLKSPIDTIILKDGSKSLSHTLMKSDQFELKNIYTTGSWKASFRDSTLLIDFGVNKFGLEPLLSKIIKLGSSAMQLEQTIYVDTLLSNEKITLKKVKIFVFEHY